MKFKRKSGLSGPHPDGMFGIGIHALSESPMTIEEILQAHRDYDKTYQIGVPKIGTLIRDLGNMVCFGFVEVVDE